MPAGLFRLWIALAAALVSAPLLSHEQSPEAHLIEQGLSTIRIAALDGNVDPAKDVFAEDLVLVSQSGKVYGRKAALFDLGNGFDTWRNEELSIRVDGDAAVVTFVNHRTRTGLGTGEVAFRVTQFWRLREGAWKLTAQSSVRLKD
ncbi:nuclear transport factor 2 family protein [Erythrobacter sp. W53]|uniref:nuclear transport factor 2 family protein n=1 Tax=Erythrobacter sp. W53 TaxID=3425947 RepID=UPI003D7671BA